MTEIPSPDVAAAPAADPHASSDAAADPHASSDAASDVATLTRSVGPRNPVERRVTRFFAVFGVACGLAGFAIGQAVSAVDAPSQGHVVIVRAPGIVTACSAPGPVAAPALRFISRSGFVEPLAPDAVPLGPDRPDIVDTSAVLAEPPPAADPDPDCAAAVAPRSP